MASRSSDDRAVHLGQLAQPGGGELDVEDEAAGADRLDASCRGRARSGRRCGRAGSARARRAASVPGRDGGEGRAQQVVLGERSGCTTRRGSLAGATCRQGPGRSHPDVTVRDRACASRCGRRATSGRAVTACDAARSMRRAPRDRSCRRGRHASRARAGRRRVVKPSRAASASRRPTPGTGRTSPASPTSPIATMPRRQRPSRSALAERQGDREVGGGLAEPHAADGRRRRRPARPSAIPARRSSTARTIATRLRVEPAGGRGAGWSRRSGATSAWTSATSGRRPSRVTVTQVPGHAAARAGTGTARSGR